MSKWALKEEMEFYKDGDGYHNDYDDDYDYDDDDDNYNNNDNEKYYYKKEGNRNENDEEEEYSSSTNTTYRSSSASSSFTENNNSSSINNNNNNIYNGEEEEEDVGKSSNSNSNSSTLTTTLTTSIQYLNISTTNTSQDEDNRNKNNNQNNEENEETLTIIDDGDFLLIDIASSPTRSSASSSLSSLPLPLLGLSRQRSKTLGLEHLMDDEDDDDDDDDNRNNDNEVEPVSSSSPPPVLSSYIPIQYKESKNQQKKKNKNKNKKNNKKHNNNNKYNNNNDDDDEEEDYIHQNRTSKTKLETIFFDNTCEMMIEDENNNNNNNNTIETLSTFRFTKPHEEMQNDVIFNNNQNAINAISHSLMHLLNDNNNNSNSNDNNNNNNKDLSHLSMTSKIGNEIVDSFYRKFFLLSSKTKMLYPTATYNNNNNNIMGKIIRDSYFLQWRDRNIKPYEDHLIHSKKQGNGFVVSKVEILPERNLMKQQMMTECKLANNIIIWDINGPGQVHMNSSISHYDFKNSYSFINNSKQKLFIVTCSAIKLKLWEIPLPKKKNNNNNNDNNNEEEEEEEEEEELKPIQEKFIFKDHKNTSIDFILLPSTNQEDPENSSTLLTIGSKKGIIKIWDYEKDEIMNEITVNGEISSMTSFNKWIIYGTSTGGIKMWDTTSEQRFAISKDGQFFKNDITYVKKFGKKVIIGQSKGIYAIEMNGSTGASNQSFNIKKKNAKVDLIKVKGNTLLAVVNETSIVAYDLRNYEKGIIFEKEMNSVITNFDFDEKRIVILSQLVQSFYNGQKNNISYLDWEGIYIGKQILTGTYSDVILGQSPFLYSAICSDHGVTLFWDRHIFPKPIEIEDENDTHVSSFTHEDDENEQNKETEEEREEREREEAQEAKRKAKKEEKKIIKRERHQKDKKEKKGRNRERDTKDFFNY